MPAPSSTCCSPCTASTSSASRALEAIPGVTLDKVSSKIGIGDAEPPKAAGMHDCAIIERKEGPTTLRYVVVFLGGYRNEGDVWRGFVQQLDHSIVAVNP